jgi:hypothetical protein
MVRIVDPQFGQGWRSSTGVPGDSSIVVLHSLHRTCSATSRSLFRPPAWPCCPVCCPCSAQAHRLARVEDENRRLSGGFQRLRGKDSNLDYLIQRQSEPVSARVVSCRPRLPERARGHPPHPLVSPRDAPLCGVRLQLGLHVRCLEYSFSPAHSRRGKKWPRQAFPT